MRSCFLLAALLVAAPAAAHDAIFADGFEWADTGEWSAAEPLRCDRIDTFTPR